MANYCRKMKNITASLLLATPGLLNRLPAATRGNAHPLALPVIGNAPSMQLVAPDAEHTTGVRTPGMN